jgi:hypothetical protein
MKILALILCSFFIVSLISTVDATGIMSGKTYEKHWIKKGIDHPVKIRCSFIPRPCSWLENRRPDLLENREYKDINLGCKIYY